MAQEKQPIQPEEQEKTKPDEMKHEEKQEEKREKKHKQEFKEHIDQYKQAEVLRSWIDALENNRDLELDVGNEHCSIPVAALTGASACARSCGTRSTRAARSAGASAASGRWSISRTSFCSWPPSG